MDSEELKIATERLKNFTQKKEFLMAIDSDGCVFDSMNPKQIIVFHPKIMEFYELWDIESYLREAAEFVNLFSRTRGYNRFIALQHIYRFLGERPEAKEAMIEQGIRLPDTTALDAYVEEYKDISLGNPTLEEYIQKKAGSSLESSSENSLSRLLAWSKAVNLTIADKIKNIPPFDYVGESLSLASQNADLVVVSQTPYEALDREWRQHNLDSYVTAIAGQEMGKKEEHIRIAAQKRYPSNKILMIGDAPGDKRAADANEALFYPIIPGRETESWKRLVKEALLKFFEGTFTDIYQEALLAEFDQALPSKPPWQEPGYSHQVSYKEIEPLRKAMYERFDPEGRLLLWKV
ncbi:HAD family hydrolase [Candidatus Aerophobetes bacterium]|uniref:HAD family hydrolase n=1 Tax=Aerophobetes bacterium TaxID=2030807 RepID=A0A523S204_UNCAE|nr:MAG: HAD family hydrolase [Candidatus Aerophobetes bacterium]